MTYRIVGAAVHFCGDDVPHKVDGVVDNAVNLGTATQCIGILHPIAETMTLCTVMAVSFQVSACPLWMFQGLRAISEG